MNLPGHVDVFNIHLSAFALSQYKELIDILKFNLASIGVVSVQRTNPHLEI